MPKPGGSELFSLQAQNVPGDFLVRIEVARNSSLYMQGFGVSFLAKAAPGKNLTATTRALLLSPSWGLSPWAKRRLGEEGTAGFQRLRQASWQSILR